MSEGIYVAEQELFRFARDIFVAAGVPEENASIVADNLTQGELHGLGSHGVSRLLSIYTQRFQEGGTKPDPDLKVLRQDGGTAVVDGDGGPGSVVGTYAMNLAIEMAEEHGSGWVAAKNSTHFGAAFLFARQALAKGMIGFSTTSTVAQVAPWGGRDGALGTNPICIAVPGGERGDIILDMATTVVARGKIQLAELEGKSIPLGWAVDKDDQPTTNPADVRLGGRMLPLGGYKGYGLALMVEIFSSLLSGAMIGRDIGSLFADLDTPQHIGHFFGAIKVDSFLPIDAFRTRMDDLIMYMKSSSLAPGDKEIFVPGEPEARKAAYNREHGIPLSAEVLAVVGDLAEGLGVAPLAPFG